MWAWGPRALDVAAALGCAELSPPCYHCHFLISLITSGGDRTQSCVAEPHLAGACGPPWRGRTGYAKDEQAHEAAWTKGNVRCRGQSAQDGLRPPGN